MTRNLWMVVVLCACTAFAQDIKQVSTGNNSPNVNGSGAPAAVGDVVVKSSPAEDALIKSAQQMDEISKTYNTLLQQARTTLDAQNKPLLDEIKTRSKKWQDKIDADTKDLKTKIDANTVAAQTQFQKETAPLQAKAVSPDTIKALEGVVKEEQNLPAGAHFDLNQKKWVMTPEVKK